MPVSKQLVQCQFGGGINTKADPKQLQAGNLLTLQDGQFLKTGEISKRFGYDILNTTIAGGGAIANGVELAAYKNELLLMDGYNVYSYIEATQNWSNRGVAISIITEDKDIISIADAQQLNPDMNTLGGITVYAYEDSRGGVRYTVLDQGTQAVIVYDNILDSQAQQPKLISFSNLIVILYENGSGGSSSLGYKTINPASPNTISSFTQIVSDGYAGFNGFPYDACISNNNLYITYLGNNSGSTLTGAIQAFYLNTSFVKNASTIVDSTAGQTINNPATFLFNFHGASNIVGDSSNHLWISWSDGYLVHTSRYTDLLASRTLSPTAVDIVRSNILTGIENPLALGTLLLCYDNGGYYDLTKNPYQINPNLPGTMSLAQLRGTTISSSGIITSIFIQYSLSIASKCFLYNGNIYINGCSESNLQSTDFTLLLGGTNYGLLSQPKVLSIITPSVGGGYQTNAMCPETIALSPGIFIFANLKSGKILSEANTIFTLLGVNSTILEFVPTNNFLNTIQSNTLLTVGGVLQSYDGISLIETGFLFYPENIEGIPVHSSGSLSAGTYQYCCTYSWTDNYGQIYESAPSVPISVVCLLNDAVGLAGPTINLTNKSGVRNSSIINIYRTQANGTTFNMITSLVAPLVNSLTTARWTFTDELSDASALSNKLLYTTGNVLANIAPPANSLISTYGNRVFLSGMSDKLQLWYSQQVVSNATSNTVPPQFCAELNINCDPRGGDITALGLLNSSLVIFKESEIFALSGNGPDATGNNSDFGDPVLITSDVGCISANSVVITPKGLMFQSAKGIYLLDQSSNLTYIGAPVEAYNNLTITSATLHSTYNQVIFTTTSGTALMYDYYFEQWSTWSNHMAADATIWNNKFVWLNTNGEVYVQDLTSFTDGTAPIFLSWTLPNLSFAGLQGYARVFRCFILGSFYGTHTLDVSVAYDFNPNYTQTATINPANGQSVGGYQIYEFRVDFNIQKCTAIRLLVSDNQTSAYNQGYAISSIVFEVGILPGGNRLPTTNTYGSQ